MIPLKIVKRHLGIFIDDDDNLLSMYVSAAISVTESKTRRAINKTTKTLVLSGFPRSGFYIEGITGPLVTVDSITYFDSSGTSQTLDPDKYDYNPGLHPWIAESYDNDWPDTEMRRDAVTITYTSGYTYDTIPHDLMMGIILLAGQFEQNREPISAVQLYEVPMSYKMAIAPYVEVQV